MPCKEKKVSSILDILKNYLLKSLSEMVISQHIHVTLVLGVLHISFVYQIFTIFYICFFIIIIEK